MNARRLDRVVFVVGLIVALCACSRFRGGKEPGDVSVAPERSGRQETSPDYEASVRDLGREHIESASRTEDASEARVVRAGGYFYREYVVYPDGPTSFEVEMRETESRTAPQQAHVTLNKVRYATRFHRNARDAAADSDFLRGTGTERLVYELRYGQWRRISSLFVAEKVEQLREGHWTAIAEEEEMVLPAGEEDRGLLGRIWSRVVRPITGRP